MKLAIWTPPYTDRSAGISALHRLCHWLNVLGHTAAVNTPVVNPDWEERLWDGDRDGTIAIYPEVVPDNPFSCTRVVRWALSDPGQPYFNSPAKFGECDLAFYYAPRFYEATKRAWGGKEPHRLMVGLWPSDMFFDWKGERPSDTMYYVGRGRDTFEKHKKKVDLDGAISFPGGYANRYELAKALRRVKTFVMFDQVGALLAEALLCGCKVLFVRADGEVIDCKPEGPECMQAFEDYARFDVCSDVENFVKLCETIKDKPVVCASCRKPLSQATSLLGKRLCSGPPVHEFDGPTLERYPVSTVQVINETAAVPVSSLPHERPRQFAQAAASNGRSNFGNGAVFRG